MAVVILLSGRQARVAAGHPWVYSSEVARIEGEFEPGDIVEVTDSRGRFIGKGYINPASKIFIRIMTRDKDEAIDRNFFLKRIRAALYYRNKVVKDSNAFRLIYGEADFIPALIVDKYGDYLSVQTLALGIEGYKGMIVDVLKEVINPKAIYERNDVSVRELEGLSQHKGFIGEEFNTFVEILENGLYLKVDMAEGQKTGYFLDQRENRLALEQLSSGARVLDCFCHTGTFSINAARFGATEVLGLDISQSALEIARENAARNGYGEICTFREGNSFDELRAMDKAGERYDLVILDPPAFTKSKNALAGAIRGYKEINLRGLKLLEKGGFLLTCSCSYHMSEELFMEVLQSSARDAGKDVRIVEVRRQAKDHPMLLASQETHYLKCVILQVL
jgi:23S rRNA (cytosine1962-C5)-methyltransferase